jgi:hypothetical protein
MPGGVGGQRYNEFAFTLLAGDGSPLLSMRWFNTTGPCQPDIHYMLPPLTRLPTLERLIAQVIILSFTLPGRPAKPRPCWRWPNN